MTEPIMTKARGDGVEIGIAIWEGKANPILSIHSLTANSRCWDLIASTLAPDHRVIAMDLRGRGVSDSPPKGYSVKHHCKDILVQFGEILKQY